MPERSKPHIDPKTPRGQRVKMEIESAQRVGQAAPAWIPRGDHFRVAKTSRTALAARIEIVDAHLQQIADRDCAPLAGVRELGPSERRALESLRPHVEGMRARLDLQLTELGETPRLEALGEIMAKLSEMRAAGVDPRWIESVSQQIDALAHKGMDFKPTGSLPGGGQRRPG